MGDAALACGTGGWVATCLANSGNRVVLCTYLLSYDESAHKVQGEAIQTQQIELGVAKANVEGLTRIISSGWVFVRQQKVSCLVFALAYDGRLYVVTFRQDKGRWYVLLDISLPKELLGAQVASAHFDADGTLYVCGRSSKWFNVDINQESCCFCTDSSHPCMSRLGVDSFQEIHAGLDGASTFVASCRDKRLSYISENGDVKHFPQTLTCRCFDLCIAVPFGHWSSETGILSALGEDGRVEWFPVCGKSQTRVNFPHSGAPRLHQKVLRQYIFEFEASQRVAFVYITGMAEKEDASLELVICPPAAMNRAEAEWSSQRYRLPIGPSDAQRGIELVPSSSDEDPPVAKEKKLDRSPPRDLAKERIAQALELRLREAHAAFLQRQRLFELKSQLVGCLESTELNGSGSSSNRENRGIEAWTKAANLEPFGSSQGQAQALSPSCRSYPRPRSRLRPSKDQTCLGEITHVYWDPGNASFAVVCLVRNNSLQTIKGIELLALAAPASLTCWCQPYRALEPGMSSEMLLIGTVDEGACPGYSDEGAVAQVFCQVDKGHISLGNILLPLENNQRKGPSNNKTKTTLPPLHKAKRLSSEGMAELVCRHMEAPWRVHLQLSCSITDLFVVCSKDAIRRWQDNMKAFPGNFAGLSPTVELVSVLERRAELSCTAWDAGGLTRLAHLLREECPADVQFRFVPADARSWSIQVEGFAACVAAELDAISKTTNQGEPALGVDDFQRLQASTDRSFATVSALAYPTFSLLL